MLYGCKSQTIPQLSGGTDWSPRVGWRREAHPWMSAYCGFFAIALQEYFPEMTLALQYRNNLAEHALLCDGDRLLDARGYLIDYEKRLTNGSFLVRDVSTEQLTRCGLLDKKIGVREAKKSDVFGCAKAWIEFYSFDQKETIPSYPSITSRPMKR